jgi:hypothetical protein
LLLKTILDRFPAFHGTTAGIISLLLSLGMTWGINKWINVNDFFISIGFSGDFVPYLIVALLVIIIISIFVFKWKAPFILGIIFITISLFTDWVYEKTIVLVAGIVLVVIGAVWAILRWRKINRLPGEIPSAKIKRNWFSLRRLMFISGLGIGIYGFYSGNNPFLIAGISLIAIWLIGTIWIWRFGKKNVAMPVSQGAAWAGKKYGMYQKQQEKNQYAKMQEYAIKMNKRRDYILMRVNQIKREMEFIRNKMIALQNKIPMSSVIEQGKIEDELRKMSKLGKRLQNEYSDLLREYGKING